MNFRWISLEAVLAIHDEQLAEHGGGTDVRDLGLLESALARPVNRAAYENPDIAELAAAYCFGVVRNHPFVDGNKRTGAVLMELFLELNGHKLAADDMSLVTTILSVADGSMGEDDLIGWLQDNIQEE